MSVAGPDIKEQAALERRVWVRLTSRCNNGCLFCLDSDSQDGSLRPRGEVEAEIRRGRQDGGERLILSGGEPTIHPDFVALLELGREVGYRWRQTITNGRMFSYGRFARQTLAAGLSEATFSMHGHTAALHDELVGVPGAFEQSLRGMDNLLGKMVVNVDIVMTRLNIPHLHEIIEFFRRRGIREFDLLHIVPFGRAWSSHRDRLYYDPAEMLPHFQRAFALRRRHDLILWTNRLPAPFLEGNEDLIQDPHKLHDEVRGRQELFRRWLRDGREPSCRGERCPHCPMARFCDLLAALPLPAAPPPDPRELFFPSLREAEQQRIAAHFVGFPRGRVWLPAELGVEELLAALPAERRPQTVLFARRHDHLFEARQVDLPPAEGAALVARFGLAGLADLPVCLGGTPDLAAPLPPCPAPADGEIDLVSLTEWFIRNRYLVKSLRCRECRHDVGCAGIHINMARNFGLGILRPQPATAGGPPPASRQEE